MSVELYSALENAVQTIVALSKDKWVDQLVWLICELKRYTSREEYEQLLGELVEALA